MSISLRFGSLVLAGGLIVAACTGSGASSPAPTATAAPATQAAPTAASTQPVASAAGTTVGTMTSSLGIVLVGPTGLTLYTHAGDTATSSTCTGGCLTAWPPLVVTAGQQPSTGAGVTGTLATFTRADGSTQVTYAGLPMYYWQGDTKPGDVTGQGIAGFSVATPAGTMPAASAPAPSAPAPSTSGGYGY